MDPAAATTHQRYSYAADDPLNSIDPSGLAPIPAFSDWCVATAGNVTVTSAGLASGTGTVACVQPLDYLQLTVEIQARGGQYVGWTTVNESVRYYTAADIAALAAQGQIPSATALANPPKDGQGYDYRTVVRIEAEKWGDVRQLTFKGRVRRGIWAAPNTDDPYTDALTTPCGGID